MFTIFPNSYKCRPCQPSLIFLQTSIHGDKPTGCIGLNVYTQLGRSQRASGRDPTEVMPEDIYNHHHDHWLKESWETEIVQNCPQLERIWPLDCLYQGFNWKLMLVQPIVRTVRLCSESMDVPALPACLQPAIEMSADWEVICIQC